MKKRTIAPTITLILATALVWVWQWFDYRSYVKAELEADQRYGDVILAGAEGAMHRQCRRRVPDLASLENTLEDVRKRVGATYLALLHEDGRAHVEAGVVTSGDAVTRRSRVFRLPPRQAGRGPPPGRGPARLEPSGDSACADCPLVDGQMEIRLEYPADRLETRLAHARLRFIAVGGALTLAFLSLFLFYMSRLRAANLRAELAATGEKVKSLEFLRRLGAGLAHETKNPLGAVRGFAEMLKKRELSEEEVRDAASRIVDETDRIVARLDEFMLLSRPTPPRRADFGLKALIEDLAGLVRLELAGKNGGLEVHGDDVVVTADREQIRRLFMNLLVNAADAIGESGRIDVEVRRHEDRVRVTVADDGPGVPEAIRSTLFEPYVTGKPGGTGLGLAIVRRIAGEHGWEVRYEPDGTRGTRIIVEAPLES